MAKGKQLTTARVGSTPERLKELPEIIKAVFDVLDLLVFRLMLLALAVIGAYSLFRHHPL